MTIVLWIPRPPDNANNRGHWRIAHAAMLRLRGELGLESAHGVVLV
jgi:hypothetical protein